MRGNKSPRLKCLNLMSGPWKDRNPYHKVLVVWESNCSSQIIHHHRGFCKTTSVQDFSRTGAGCPDVLLLPTLNPIASFAGLSSVLLGWLVKLIPFKTATLTPWTGMTELSIQAHSRERQETPGHGNPESDFLNFLGTHLTCQIQ